MSTGVVGVEEGAPVAAPRPAKRPRLTQLDGVRAVLLAIVIINHLVYVAPYWLGLLLPGAWLALDVFFILSGFFIGSLLLKEIDRTGSISYRSFITSRLFRIYPALLLMLVVTTLTLRRDGFATSDLAKPLLTNMTFVFNWPFGFDWGWQKDYSILYTLGIEFQFYLLLPLLMLALVRLKASRAVWLGTMLTIIGASALTRALMWNGPQTFPGPYSYTHTRLDNLFVGVVAALAVHWGWVGRRMTTGLNVLVLPAVAFLAWVLWTSSLIDAGLYHWKMTAVGWAAVVIVLWLATHATHPVSTVLGWRPIAVIGEMSFAAYLWHYPIVMYAARHGGNIPEKPRVALVVGVTLVLSYLTFRLLEQPMNRVRRRLVRSPGSAPKQPAPATAEVDRTSALSATQP